MFFVRVCFKIHKDKTLNVSDNTLCFRKKVELQIVIVVAETIVGSLWSVVNSKRDLLFFFFLRVIFQNSQRE